MLYIVCMAGSPHFSSQSLLIPLLYTPLWLMTLHQFRLTQLRSLRFLRVYELIFELREREGERMSKKRVSCHCVSISSMHSWAETWLWKWRSRRCNSSNGKCIVIATAAAFFIPDRGCQRVPRTKLNAFLTVYMTRWRAWT